MPTPDFVLALRSHVGTAPLWLSGCTAVIRRDDRVLLVRRADNGRWTPVTGIIDPGEQPAAAAAREAWEEAAVRVEAVRLASVGVTDPVTHENGDRCQYLDLTFECRWLSGDPHPADGENSEVAWFARNDMPEMTKEMHARVDAALSGEAAARFEGGKPGAKH